MQKMADRIVDEEWMDAVKRQKDSHTRKFVLETEGKNVRETYSSHIVRKQSKIEKKKKLRITLITFDQKILKKKEK